MLILNLIQMIISGLFLLLIFGLVLWAISNSKVKNCCNNFQDFKNCKANFGTKFDMNSEDNYKKICTQ